MIRLEHADADSEPLALHGAGRKGLTISGYMGAGEKQHAPVNRYRHIGQNAP